MIKPSTRLATTGSVEAITPQPRAPVLDGMMQRRNTVNDYPPADEEHGQRPDDGQHLHQAGSDGQEPFTQPLRQRTTFSASQ